MSAKSRSNSEQLKSIQKKKTKQKKTPNQNNINNNNNKKNNNNKIFVSITLLPFFSSLICLCTHFFLFFPFYPCLSPHLSIPLSIFCNSVYLYGKFHNSIFFQKKKKKKERKCPVCLFSQILFASSSSTFSTCPSLCSKSLVIKLLL